MLTKFKKCLFLFLVFAAYSKAHGQAYIKGVNFIAGVTSTASSGGVLQMSCYSSQMNQEITGTLTHTVRLPLGSGCAVGVVYYIHNKSTQNVTLQNSAATTLATIYPGAEVSATLKTASTPGVWIISGNNINLPTEVNGLLGLSNGGSNAALTAAAGGVVWTNSTQMQVSAAGTSGQVLLSNGTSAPSFGAVSLSGTGITGVLPLANGGTNANLTAVNGGVLWSNATQAQITAAGNAGQILRSNGAAAPTWSTATFPNTATNAGRILTANGTNWVESTATYPSTIATAPSALVANTANTVSALDATTANRVLRTNGTALSFAQVALTTDVSGQLPLTNGGSNASLTAVNGGVVWSNSTQMQISAAGTSGQYLRSAGAGAPVFNNLQTVTNSTSLTAGGTITISATLDLQTVRVASTSGVVALSTTPFSTTNPPNGARITLIGTSDSNAVTVATNDAADGLILNGPATLYNNDILVLEYNSTSDRFIEVTRSR